MKIVFFYSELKEREIKILEALKAGAAKHGDIVEGVPTSQYCLRLDADVAAVFGVKGISKVLLTEYSKIGIHTLYIDKGYTRCTPRGRHHYKFVVDGFNRDDIGNIGHDKSRLLKLRGEVLSYRENDGAAPVIVTGSSAKFHEFIGIPEPQTYTHTLLKKLYKMTCRPIIYRPKPSWQDAQSIDGSRFSQPPETLQNLFSLNPHALITYGSNAGVDALFAGIPVISLNNMCVTENISSNKLENLEDPYIPTNKQRTQWLQDLAYQQWTLDEFASGEAWANIKRDIRP